MYVTPSCFHVPYHGIIEDILAGEGDAHVVLRDTFQGDSNNAGTFMVRNSAPGRFFVDLVLSRQEIPSMLWWQADQASFDNAILELLAIEKGCRK